MPDASNYSELMTLACKNALLGPGDEVQTLAAREGRPGGPKGASAVRDRAARRRWSEVLTDAELI
ncbi:MAG TPA: hypothetical protein VGC59_00315 [Solirubrobacteraceae bacterium]